MKYKALWKTKSAEVKRLRDMLAYYERQTKKNDTNESAETKQNSSENVNTFF